VVDTDHEPSKSPSFTPRVKEDETRVKSPYDLIRRVFTYRVPTVHEVHAPTDRRFKGDTAVIKASGISAWLRSRTRGQPFPSLHRLPQCRALVEAARPGGGLPEAIHFRRVADDEEGAPWEVQVRQLILATDGTKVPRAPPDGALAPKDHVVIPRPRRRLVVSAVARTLRHPRPPIGRSSAGRRSRSCASPSSTPRWCRPSATTAWATRCPRACGWSAVGARHDLGYEHPRVLAELHWTPEWAELLDPARPAACFVYEEGRSSQWNRFEAVTRLKR